MVELTAQIGDHLLHCQLYALPVCRRSSEAAIIGKARCALTALDHCMPQVEKLGCIEAQPNGIWLQRGQDTQERFEGQQHQWLQSSRSAADKATAKHANQLPANTATAKHARRALALTTPRKGIK